MNAMKIAVLGGGNGALPFYEIHRASLEVLEKAGYKIESKAAVNLLKQAGARVNGNIVKTPQHIIL